MERDANLVSPVNFLPNGGLEQKLTGDSTTTSSSSSPLRSDEKVKSRYLSPHMASCHDFCKYGKKHDSDAEERRLNLRKFLKKKKKEKSAQGEEQNQVTIVVPAERRIRTVTTKPKATTKVGTEFPDNAGGPKPQTPPTMKISIISGEKKTLKSSLDTEQGQAKSQDSGDGRKVKVIKGGTKLHMMETQLPDNTEGPKPQTPPTMENRIASGEKKSLQTSLVNIQGQAKSLSPRDGKKVKIIKGGTPLPSLQSRPPNQPDTVKLEDLLPASVMDGFKQPNINDKEKTKSSVNKPISPVAPKVIKPKAPPSVTEHQKIKQKVPPPAKRVDCAGKPAITLKTKAPLVRSLSQRKSSRNLIARRNQENKTMRSLGISKIGARELLKPSTTSFSSKSSRNLTALRNQDNKVAKSLTTSKVGERKILKPKRLSFSSMKPEDNASSLQLRKLRSMKRTSTPHETGLSLPLRKLRSTKLNSVPNDSVPSMQPRKLRSIKQTSKPHDSVPSLQLRKLRSVKQTSTPHENGSSLQPRKLWNVKLTSALRDSVSILQPRKLRSMKRNSSVKDEDKVGKANNADSKSGINDFDPNLEIDESESAISGVSDEEIEGNDNVEVSKDDEKKRARRTVTAPAQPEDNSSTPFKLKFKRGKVINFRSDSIGARRLWFNLGRLASDNLNGNGLLGRRSFRRRRNNASIDSKDPDSEVQSVVLKHQGVKEKKDGQALFNHVIEETASKLVETRKSKVKALVGAFETVISLQKSKPASAV